MKLPYKISEAASVIYRAGVSYHAFGTIKQGRAALFNYYKCDKVTEEQLETIRQYCPDVQVKGIAPTYAPELRSVALCFPKIAFYRMKGAAK
jgi:hypothetical protein